MRLDSRILGMDLGVSYGSGALKALQNDNLPELDLLVREAIQNSSDAALGQNGSSFAVNFTYKTFQPHRFNCMLGDVADLLNEKYPENEAKFLEIRDSKTSGLTGEVRITELNADDHGNYFKLIFDTGKEQTGSNEGEAGGSWGYGKSVYYRVGIGIVLYYSQICVNGEKESRLIVSLIEKETDTSAILKSVRDDAIGRAWWGIKDLNNPKEILPVTDEAEIDKILDVFSVKRFKDNQTGTSIIIPYIDENKLLMNLYPDNCGISDDEISMCTFKDSVVDYLKLSVQKWYAPKIFNKNLEEYGSQKWLMVRVNDEPIRDKDMRPLFRLIQELFTTALCASGGKTGSYHSEQFKQIKCVPVPSAKIEGGIAGYVAFARVTEDDISATGSVISPFTYLRLFGKATNTDPIMMYARNPGMILDYKIDGEWAKGILKSEDAYTFGFFVPICSAKLKKDSKIGKYSGMALGEYLRKLEKSDHLEWNDPSTMTLVTNIKKQVVNKINLTLKDTEKTPVEGTAGKLSGRLGKRLLPSMKFLNKKKSGGGGGTGGGSSSSDLEFAYEVKEWNETTVEVSFSLTFKNIRKAAYIGLYVGAEVGNYDAKAWTGGIKTPFPVEVIQVSAAVYAVNLNKQLGFEKECTKDNPVIENDFSKIQILLEDTFMNTQGIKFSNTINNSRITGTILLGTRDKKYSWELKETKFPNNEG